MELYTDRDSVCCDKCGEHPEFIIWDYSFDYDGNDRVHTYGQYKCKCGDSRIFSTNDPYEDDTDIN